MRYEDYPSAATFSHIGGNTYEEKYYEGIYVGYRYFDTFGVPCRYPFGYGLSYTSFSLNWGAPVGEKGCCRIPVTVTNTGAVPGREVVQLYCSCPTTRWAKEKRRLVGFRKTGLLAPGESRVYEISFPLSALESWHSGQGAYYMEEGNYYLFGGVNLESASLCGILQLNSLRWVQRLDNICPLLDDLKELTPGAEQVQIWRSQFDALAEDAGLMPLEIDRLVENRPRPHYGAAAPETKHRPLLEKMSVEEKALLCCGRLKTGKAEFIGSAAVTVPGAAGETAGVLARKHGIGRVVLADGPAGLRLTQKYQLDDRGDPIDMEPVPKLLNRFFGHEYLEEGRQVHYQYCSAIPIGTLLAQSFDEELLQEVGGLIRREMDEFGVALWLAPGMNIHRNPLCGRNFEYYSEDPLVSGRIAAAMTRGVQQGGGAGVTIKHFACNNQEENRMGVSSVVSERALREIYLKGFEIAVKEAAPLAIMTSYNKINCVHTANSYDLCTKVAREEWGFDGVIMTDWTTTNGHGSSAAKCIAAGNDLVMPGTEGDVREIGSAVRGEGDQRIAEKDLDACAERMLELLDKCTARFGAGQ